MRGIDAKQYLTTSHQRLPLTEGVSRGLRSLYGEVFLTVEAGIVEPIVFIAPHRHFQDRRSAASFLRRSKSPPEGHLVVLVEDFSYLLQLLICDIPTPTRVEELTFF